MAIPFLNNINLDDNQLQNAKLHVKSSAPTAAQGQIYFDSTDNVAKYHDGTSWINIPRRISVGGTPLAYSQAIDIVAGTNVSVVESTGTITISSTDQFTGTVTSVATANSTFISGSGGPITTSGTLTFSLSATGTPSATTYLRGDNSWSPISGIYDWTISDGTNSEVIASGDTVTFTGTGSTTTSYDTATNTLTIDSGNETITLSGEVTGSGTTAITTTVANNVLDIDNFTAATIVTEAEGIASNDNDTTIPTSAAVKDYVDTSIVGGLVYQGGYNASTNTPDLTTSPNSIKKGWTYTVTTAGTFFTTEVLEIGDVLIAEIDNPSSLADWTTVQNNTDLASLTQVGIGNVNAGTGISVSYSSGTATVTNTDTNSANTYATTITDTATITHSLNTRDVIIELYDTVTYETVYADVVRTSTTTATITFATTPTNSIRVLVQKIG